MSVLRPGPERQPLLSPAVEHSVNEAAIRVSGGALIAFAVASWLALLSWQLRDPGGAAGRGTRNLLGSFGAGLSDMLVNTVGLAAVFVLICPMIWGMELLAGVRWIERFRIKLLSALGAVLALAGFASGLPSVPGWPLLGGAGGMVGDLVHNLASSSFARHGYDRGTALATLALAGAGLWLLLLALGVKLAHIAAQLGWNRSNPETKPAGAASATPTMQPAVAAAAERVAAQAVTAQPPAPTPVIIHVSTHTGSLNDDETDNSTRAFAERFAPGVATGRPAARPHILPALAASTSTRSAVFRRPSLNLLRRGSSDKRHDVDVEGGAAVLLDVLASFGVKGEIREVRPGPVVTRYELEPARGTKIARVIGLADDFARELGATSVRVSTTPGRTTIGIEVPNQVRETVVLRDILESDVFAAEHIQLPLALGKGIAGEPVVLDLARMPHLLVAGTTGSGKSVGLNAMILSLLYRYDPSELRLLLIDPKMLEMAQYDRIPHLLAPVVTNPVDAAQALEWACAEMEERYRRMAQQSTRNIEAFNGKVRAAISTGVGLTRTVQTGFDGATGRAIYERQQLDDAPMPYIVIVIDELADLMVTAGKKVEGAVQRLAQKARAAGIHLVMATQRPSVDVVTGTIKANFPARIAFRVASKIDSRTIINEPGAELLLGSGDMLLTSGPGNHLRVHGAWVADAEIERVVEALREQGEPAYVDLLARPGAVTKTIEPRQVTEAQRRDEIYATAIAIVTTDRKVSPGHLHRRMGVTEAAAAGLIERMEHDGLVSPVNLLGRREILVDAPKRAPAAKVRSAA